MKNIEITERDWGEGGGNIRLKNCIKNCGFTLIGPKAHEGNDNSRRATHKDAFTRIKPTAYDRNEVSERERNYKTGFTLIELIVVMAVIGILVLLAAPKFLGYTEQAKYTRDIHLAKTLETGLEDFLVHGGKLEDHLEEISRADIQASADKNMLLNPRGFVEVVEDGVYYELTHDFIRNHLNVKVANNDRLNDVLIEAMAAKYPVAAYAEQGGKALVDRTRGLKGHEIEEEPDIVAPEICPTPESLNFEFDHLTGTITKYTGTEVHIVIPPFLSVDDKCYRVKVIGKDAFIGKGIFTVQLPSTIITIEDGAFSDNNLTDIIIPEGTVTIGDNSFKNNYLGPVMKPNDGTVTRDENIPGSPYEGDYSGVILPDDSLQTIGNGAFENNNLETIIIPDSVDNIGDNAFKDNNVSVIDVPSNVVIGDNIFAGNESTTVTISPGVTTIPANTFNGSGIISVVFPEGLERIEDYAFAYNKIINVNLPSSLVYIGNYAFAYNETNETRTITSITYKESEYISTLDNQGDIIQGGVKANIMNGLELKEHIFIISNSEGTEPVTPPDTDPVPVPDPNWPPVGPIAPITPAEYFSIYEYETTNEFVIEEFFPTGMNGTLPLITDVVIPETINGNSILYIGASAFNNKGLTSVFIPSTIKHINTRAFANNVITSLTLPEGLTSISLESFANNKIKSLIIPDTLDFLAKDSFKTNPIEYLRIPDDTKTLLQNDFDDSIFAYRTFKEVQIYKGDKASDLTWIFSKSAGSRSTTSINKLTIEAGVETILDQVFEGVSINEVNLPLGLKTIGKKAFYESVIPSLIIPDSVVTIDDYAFSFNGMTSVHLPESLTTLGREAFKKNNLTQVQIPSNLQTIGIGAFSFNNLTSVVIPSNVKTIAPEAFKSNKIASLTFEHGIERIGRYAFETNLIKNISLPDSMISMGLAVFKSNIIDKLIIPDDIFFADDTSFSGATFVGLDIGIVEIYKGDKPSSLRDIFYYIPTSSYTSQTKTIGEIIVHEGVTEIPTSAFQYIPTNKVTLPESLKTIKTRAFYFSKIALINIPSGITSIESEALSGNSFTQVTIPSALISLAPNAFATRRTDSTFANITGDLAVIRGKTFKFISNEWMMQ